MHFGGKMQSFKLKTKWYLQLQLAIKPIKNHD